MGEERKERDDGDSGGGGGREHSESGRGRVVVQRIVAGIEARQSSQSLSRPEAKSENSSVALQSAAALASPLIPEEHRATGLSALLVHHTRTSALRIGAPQAASTAPSMCRPMCTRLGGASPDNNDGESPEARSL